MADQKIRPVDLPPRTNPVPSEVVPSDNGSVVGGVTWANGVAAGRPLASQAEAEAGVNPSKAMTPLTTAQAIAALAVPNSSVSRGKLSQSLSTAIPRDLSEFGAIGDGVADDSAAVAAWLASSAYLTASQGTYLTGRITVPSTLKCIRGQGAVLFKSKTGAFTQAETAFQNEWDKDISYTVNQSSQFMPTFETIAAGLSPDGLMYRCKVNNTNKPPSLNPTEWEVIAFEDFWYFPTLVDATIENVGFHVTCLSNPQIRTVDFSGCSGLRTSNLRFPEGGGVAIYNGNCVNVVHEGTQVSKFAWQGMFAEGSSQRRITFSNCHVDTSGTGTAHGICFSLGRQCQAIGCTSKNARTFGFTANEVDGFVLDGISIDTGHEGFNTISGKNGIIRGVAKWEDVLSTDFGASIDGTTGTGVSNIMVNLVVQQSGVSALCITGTVTDCVAHVIAKDCNQTDAAGEAGILFTGSNCQRNTGHVTMVDSYTPHRMRYGIAEIDKGNGAPSNNKLVVDSSIGHLTGEVLRAGPTTKIFGASRKVFTSTITSSTPTLTSAAGTIEWSYDGVFVVIDKLDITITTNGTGAGEIRATLPLAAVSEGGFISAKEVAVSGKAVTGEIGTSYIILRFYDNTYPGANSARIVGSGRYRPSV